MAVHGVTPEKDRFLALAEQVTGMAGTVPGEIDGTHAGDHLVGIAEGHEPAGVAVGAKARATVSCTSRCMPVAAAARVGSNQWSASALAA